jgi:hypothetical protein
LRNGSLGKPLQAVIYLWSTFSTPLIIADLLCAAETGGGTIQDMLTHSSVPWNGSWDRHASLLRGTPVAATVEGTVCASAEWRCARDYTLNVISAAE